MDYREWNEYDDTGEEWYMARNGREQRIYNEVFGDFNRKLLTRQTYMPYEEILEKKKKLNQQYQNRIKQAREELVQKARKEYERTHKTKEPEPIPLWEKIFSYIFFAIIVIAYLTMG